MKIANREIGLGHPCFIVAEISCNHMGNESNAYKLIDCAWWAGADAVKMQCFGLEEILALRGEGQAMAPWDAYTKRELYTLAQTPFDWFPGLFKHARGRGIIPFSSVMGAESLALLESLDCPAYKIAKPERCSAVEIAGSVMGRKPVIVSLDLMDVVQGWIQRVWCPSGYPAHVAVDSLPYIRYELGWHQPVLGLSLHDLNPALPVEAVRRGAKYLEYHLKLNATTPLDDAFSHTPQSFKDMVDSVRRTEAMLG